MINFCNQHRKAANLGDQVAQFNLGQGYCYKNQITPQLFPVCFALLSLSAMHDESGVSEEALKTHIKEMSQVEIEKGKELTLEMQKPGNLLTALDKFINENW